MIGWLDDWWLGGRDCWMCVFVWVAGLLGNFLGAKWLAGLVRLLVSWWLDVTCICVLPRRWMLREKHNSSNLN